MGRTMQLQGDDIMSDWFDEALAQATVHTAPTPKPTKAPKPSAAARPPRKIGRYSEAVRREAIRLVTEEGYTYETAAQVVGATKPSVARWVKNHLVNKGVLDADYEPEPREGESEGSAPGQDAEQTAPPPADKPAMCKDPAPRADKPSTDKKTLGQLEVAWQTAQSDLNKAEDAEIAARERYRRALERCAYISRLIVDELTAEGDV